MSRKILTTMFVVGLLAGVAPSALAQGPNDPSTGPGANSDHQNQGAGEANATARQQAAQERRESLQAARSAVLASFHENRALILEEYRASLNETRAAFLAAKADVLASCNETRAAFTNNTGSSEPPEHAKCVSDGLAPLIAEARADNRAARELALSKLREERTHGLSTWAKSFREANEHYKARTGDEPSGA